MGLPIAIPQEQMRRNSLTLNFNAITNIVKMTIARSAAFRSKLSVRHELASRVGLEQHLHGFASRGCYCAGAPRCWHQAGFSPRLLAHPISAVLAATVSFRPEIRHPAVGFRRKFSDEIGHNLTHHSNTSPTASSPTNT